VKPQLPWRRRQRPSEERSRPRKSSLITFVRKHAAILTLAGGAIGWIVLNSGPAYSNIQKAWEWWRVDHTYSGRWSNDGEGYVDNAPPGALMGPSPDRVELAIHVEGGEVMGDIHSPRLCKHLPWQYVMIDGRRRWWGFGGLWMRAWDHIRGERTGFGDFEVHHDWKTDTIEVRTLRPTPFFPDRVQLHRIESSEGNTVSDKIDPFCDEYLDRYAGGARPPSSHAAQRAASAAKRAALAANAASAARDARACTATLDIPS
jgi:hypothetical protein